MSIGDVNSNERGSGARYNDGKIKMEYLPMHVLNSCILADLGERDSSVAVSVADFEAERDPEYLVFALDCIGFRDVCDVFHYGAQKYAAWNWAKGMPWSVPMACIKRHMLAIAAGEEIDAESGLPHIGHVGCNIVMLLHYLRCYPEGNDLPPRECFGGKTLRGLHDEILIVDDGLPEEPVGYECAVPMPGCAPLPSVGYKHLTSEDYAAMRAGLIPKAG